MLAPKKNESVIVSHFMLKVSHRAIAAHISGITIASVVAAELTPLVLCPLDILVALIIYAGCISSTIETFVHLPVSLPVVAHYAGGRCGLLRGRLGGLRRGRVGGLLRWRLAVVWYACSVA